MTIHILLLYIKKKNWKFNGKSCIVVVLWELRTVVNLYLVMEKVLNFSTALTSAKYIMTFSWSALVSCDYITHNYSGYYS
jgi:hypothetical protein